MTACDIRKIICEFAFDGTWGVIVYTFIQQGKGLNMTSEYQYLGVRCQQQFTLLLPVFTIAHHFQVPVLPVLKVSWVSFHHLNIIIFKCTLFIPLTSFEGQPRLMCLQTQSFYCWWQVLDSSDGGAADFLKRCGDIHFMKSKDPKCSSSEKYKN